MDVGFIAFIGLLDTTFFATGFTTFFATIFLVGVFFIGLVVLTGFLTATFLRGSVFFTGFLAAAFVLFGDTFVPAFLSFEVLLEALPAFRRMDAGLVVFFVAINGMKRR